MKILEKRFPNFKYDYNRGLCIMVEQPPTGGRHRKTFTYGKNSSNPELKKYLDLTPEEALEFDLEDLRKIHKDDGLYSQQVEDALQSLKRQVKNRYKEVFK